MRAVVQRVRSGKVLVEKKIIGSIGKGLVILLGVGQDDGEEDLKYMVDKIINLRIFSDAEGKMNHSVKDIEGDVLVVSQFTLYGDCRKGRRPSFSKASMPQKAEELYNKFISLLEAEGIRTASGEFQASMEVQIFNDGPVTLLIDSTKNF